MAGLALGGAHGGGVTLVDDDRACSVGLYCRVEWPASARRCNRMEEVVAGVKAVRTCEQGSDRPGQPHRQQLLFGEHRVKSSRVVEI